MKLFNFILLIAFMCGSFSVVHCAGTVTAQSCFSNPSTYIGKNIQIAGARVNVWQVMQGMEALALLLKVKEKNMQPCINRLPMPARNVARRVLQLFKKNYPKFSSIQIYDHKTLDDCASAEDEQSSIDTLQTHLCYNPNTSIRDTKDYMQSYWFIYMLVSLLAHGFSFNDAIDGAGSSITVGGIHFLENAAVRTIGDRNNFSDQGRDCLQAGFKLAALGASAVAQFFYGSDHIDMPCSNPAALIPAGNARVAVVPLAPMHAIIPSAPPLPPVASRPSSIPVPPAPPAPPFLQRKQGSRSGSLAAQLKKDTSLKHVEHPAQSDNCPSVAQLQGVTLNHVDLSSKVPVPHRHLKGRVTPDELQKGVKNLKPTVPVVTSVTTTNPLFLALSNEMDKRRQAIAPNETGSSGTGASWFFTDEEGGNKQMADENLRQHQAPFADLAHDTSKRQE